MLKGARDSSKVTQQGARTGAEPKFPDSLDNTFSTALAFCPRDNLLQRLIWDFV